MRDSEYTANEHMANAALRTARAVIDHGYLERYEFNERQTRRREVGARAVGMLSGLLKTGDLPECYRDQAQRLIEEWER